jgi:hypothetical protein
MFPPKKSKEEPRICDRRSIFPGNAEAPGIAVPDLLVQGSHGFTIRRIDAAATKQKLWR